MQVSLWILRVGEGANLGTFSSILFAMDFLNY